MDNKYSNFQEGTNIDGICFCFHNDITYLISGTSPALSAAAVHDNGNQKSKDKNKPKDPKCNNVQILLNVSKMPKGSKALGGASNIGWKDRKQEATR